MKNSTKIRKATRKKYYKGIFPICVIIDTGQTFLFSTRYKTNGPRISFLKSSKNSKTRQKRMMRDKRLGKYNYYSTFDLDNLYSFLCRSTVGKFRLDVNHRRKLPVRIYFEEETDITMLFFCYRDKIKRIYKVTTS